MLQQIFTSPLDATEETIAKLRPRKGVIIGAGQVGLACAYYAIGNIKEGSLIQQAKNWKTSLYQPFLKLNHQVFESLVNTDNSQLPFANWYGLITQASQQKMAEKVSL
ncbi:MAG: hypothetical protein WBF90_18280 [Rivularia sp. (in: cyanobacteria)]|jgi:hypothetical protein